MRDQDKWKEQLKEESISEGAEEALRTERQQLLSIFDSINEVISVADAETYEILYANKFTKEHHGQELIGGICFKELHGADRPCSYCAMAIAKLLKGEPYRWEYHNPTNNRDYFATDTIIKWTDGRDAKFHLGIDITERKRAEKALEESEASFRALSEHTFEAIFLSEKGICTGQNVAAERMFGYSNEEAIGKPGMEWIAPEHRELVGKNIVRDYAPPYEVLALRKDGTTFPCEIQAKMIDRERRIRVTSLRDITERKKAEEALRESELRYRVLFDNSPDGILIAGVETKRFAYANPSACRMLGYSSEELRTLGVADIHPPDQLPHVIAEFDAQARGEKVLAPNLPCLRKDGTVFYADISTIATVLDGTVCNVGFFRDITERKKAEEALRASEDRYRQITENSLTGIFIHQDGVAVFGNQRLADMLGYTTEEMIGRNVFNGVHSEDRKMVGARVQARLRGELSSAPHQLRLLKKTGEAIWCEVLATRIDYQGRPAVMGNLVDITDSKKAEVVLRESEEFNRRLVEHAPFGIAYLAADGTFEYANPAANRIAGIPEGQISPLLGRKIFEIPGIGDLPRVQEGMRRLLDGESLSNREIAYTSSTGRDTVLLFSATPRFGPDGTFAGVILMFTDISELKKAQEIQRETARYRAVADLAGGVAHNFNNLLQIVLGNMELAIMDLELGNYADVKEELGKVLESARLGTETVRRLQSFAGIRDHSQVSEKGVFDLSGVVRQALDISKTWWKSLPEKEGIEVSLETELQEGCLVRGERNELFEVVVNLIKNAVEALPQGGSMDVKTSIEDTRVVLKVRDTGIGISEDNLRRMFNPFFTTKASTGSGLGLASSRKIIEDCGGSIIVESSEGIGTTFTIRLPLAEQPADQARPRTEEVPASGKTVLVIDDMQAVLDLLKTGLTRSGHMVVTALSGLQGLEIFRENPIDIVICDLGMPGINGWEVGKRITSICEERGIPKIPFILLTGWGGQKTETEKIAESGVDAVVEKPINMGNLRKMIQEMCDKEASQVSQ